MNLLSPKFQPEILSRHAEQDKSRIQTFLNKISVKREKLETDKNAVKNTANHSCSRKNLLLSAKLPNTESITSAFSVRIQ